MSYPFCPDEQHILYQMTGTPLITDLPDPLQTRYGDPRLPSPSDPVPGEGGLLVQGRHCDDAVTV